jgi:hypothetical protein
MSVVQVLVDDKGNVLGTARLDAKVTGSGPRPTLVARAGQRLVEVKLGPGEARLAADDLHRVLKAKHLG